MTLSAEDWVKTRTSLVNRLRGSAEDPAWISFCDAYGRFIHNAARRGGLGESDAEDVVQEVFRSVVESIGRYDRAKGKFRTWLMTLTVRRMADWRRKRREVLGTPSTPTEDSGTGVVDRIPDENPLAMPSFMQDAWSEQCLRVAEERVARRTPEDYQLYSALVHDQLPAARVAELMGVSPERVYVAKNRVIKALNAEIRSLEEGEGF